MTHYKFIYFNVRGRGEFIRFMFHQTNTKYEEVTVKVPFQPESEWPQMKDKMPTGQLPVLEVDGHQIATTIAIGTFLAKKLGLNGKDDIESAQAIMYVDVLQDVILKLVPAILPKVQHDEEKFNEVWPKIKEEHVTAMYDRYEHFLKENGTGYLVGKQLTWADLLVAEWLQRLHDVFDSSLFDKCPLVKEYARKIHELPNIKKYIEQRPEMFF